jgi:hypothetical protein
MSGGGKPYEYLNAATADYSDTQLDVTPQDVMFETGAFKQRGIQYDDRSVQVITWSEDPEFYFRLKWDVLEEADADTIFDMYFDVLKAKGMARTFEFLHPVDGVTYIVRFWSKIERSLRYYRGFSEIVLKAEGYKAS